MSLSRSPLTPIRVATALIDRRVLLRTHAITLGGAVHNHMQISMAYDGELFAVYRKPHQAAGSMPAWHSARGVGTNSDGHYGLFSPRVEDLLSWCRLVRLAADDRPPPVQLYDHRGWQLGAPILYPPDSAIEAML